MTGRLVRLDRSHLEAAANVLAQAFARDPIAKYVFAVSETSFEDSGRALFTFSCEVRLLLDWPLLGVIEEDGFLVGVAGLSLPGDPTWPPALHQVYADFKTTVGADSASRMERYAELADTNRPSEPHYQLGVIGVAPEAQGKGYGGLMLQETHRMSEINPDSTGVWLDTENMENVSFYQHHGYEVRAQTTLDGLNIWGMFRPNHG
jgi:predicted GNAT family N-acyltransferase